VALLSAPSPKRSPVWSRPRHECDPGAPRPASCALRFPSGGSAWLLHAVAVGQMLAGRWSRAADEMGEASALPALESLDVLLTWRNERPLVSDQQRHLLTASRQLLEDLEPLGTRAGAHHSIPLAKAALQIPRAGSHHRRLVVSRDDRGASPLGWPSC
jgi:hypothetical protein